MLTDPKHEFGFQNVALIIKQSVLSAEGPAFAKTVNAVSALLTTKAIIALNAAVVLDKQSPASVAHTFLRRTASYSRARSRPVRLSLSARRPAGSTDSAGRAPEQVKRLKQGVEPAGGLSRRE